MAFMTSPVGNIEGLPIVLQAYSTNSLQVIAERTRRDRIAGLPAELSELVHSMINKCLQHPPFRDLAKAGGNQGVPLFSLGAGSGECTYLMNQDGHLFCSVPSEGVPVPATVPKAVNAYLAAPAHMPDLAYLKLHRDISPQTTVDNFKERLENEIRTKVESYCRHVARTLIDMGVVNPDLNTISV